VLAEPLEVGDRLLEAVEVLGRVGDEHGRRAQALGQIAVGSAQAEDVVDARLVGHKDLVGVHRVDAEDEAAFAQLGDHRGALVEPAALEREAEVDHVGAGVAVVAGELEDLVPAQPRDVVDLREHADVAGAVAGAGVGLPEPARDLFQVGGALLGGDPEALGQYLGLALAEAGDHDPRDLLGRLEEARDPAGGHQRGHSDLHDRDVVVERQLGAVQRVTQGRRGELAGHKQEPLGHGRVRVRR
jgi:hypothetical protein